MVLSAPIEARAIIADKRVEDYIGHQEEEAQRSISQLPQLKEEYYRFLLLELFDFHDIFYKEEHLLHLMTEFFYQSFTDITELHKRVLSNFSAQTMSVSEKWLQKIRQSTVEALHSEDFQERVKRSAEWFESSIQEVFAQSIDLAIQIKSNNKQAMSRFPDALADVRQAVLSRRFLLSKIAEQGFSIPIYLHEKQYSLLDAIDEQQIKKPRKQRAKKEKPKKEPKEKTWNITFRLYKEGLKPDEIAKIRNLTVTTIINHLAHFIPMGAITLSELVPQEHQDAILKVIQTIGKGETKTAIKSLCPPEVTYQEIELMLEALK
jgi:uncharacterized protein YpbB